VKQKGRGVLSNPAGRFQRLRRERFPEAGADIVSAALLRDATRSIISRNKSPDLPFEQSINPYRGCEHGCVYCYARPTHAYLDLSPGRDFETRILFKPRARERLLEELARPGYAPSPIALGTNTDPYQPVERRLRITRSILETCLEVRHPVKIVTKGCLIERDLDVLERMASQRLVSVAVSLTTLDDELKRRMEPRAAGPRRRLATLRLLRSRGVPAGVLLAPIIPAINDHEIERMLAHAARAGATWAGYALIRLPHEVRSLFAEWLLEHYPERASHVESLIRQMRAGRMNDPRFHSRQKGSGEFARLIGARFSRACRKHDLASGPGEELETGLFRPPKPEQAQLGLW
jgi:DNA repair photolyase